MLVEHGHDMSGPTSRRPTNAEIGQEYYDTTIGAMLVYGNNGWQVGSAVKNTATIAATGSTQANAAQIVTGSPCFVLVTAGDGTKGVILPAAAAGLEVTIKNGAAAILKVYPSGAGVINALSASAAISMAANTCATFHCYDGTTWYTSPLLPS